MGREGGDGRSRGSFAAPGEPAGTGRRLPSSARLGLHALDVLGVSLFGAGLLILVRTCLRAPIRALDEGILLTGSMLLLQGEALYRDFYSNYPPGIFLTIAGLWKLFGVDVMASRYLGLAIQLGLALTGGLLAGRAAGRHFSPFCAGLVIAWLCLLGDVPYAWLAGLLAVLLFIERFGVAAGSMTPGRWLASGVAFGAVGCFRHDLAAYFGLTLAVLLSAWAIRARRGRLLEGRLRPAAWGLAAAAVLLALVWAPTLARAGARVALADLVFDQVRYVMPSRVLPLPELTWSPPELPWLALPAFGGQPFEGAVALALAAPALGAFAVLLVVRLERRIDLDLLLTTALAVAVLPQLLGRTDLEHALFSVAPALILGAVLAERAASLARRLVPVVAACTLVGVLAAPVVPSLGDVVGRRLPSISVGPFERYGGLSEESEGRARSRREVLHFIEAHSQRGDPIFVGCADHRYPVESEMDLYFLSDRTGAVRYMQFDPGLVGRREVQEEMVRELEERRPAVVVLSRQAASSEPNESFRAGATVLDEYLRYRYSLARSDSFYLLLLRR